MAKIVISHLPLSWLLCWLFGNVATLSLRMGHQIHRDLGPEVCCQKSVCIDLCDFMSHYHCNVSPTKTFYFSLYTWYPYMNAGRALKLHNKHVFSSTVNIVKCLHGVTFTNKLFCTKIISVLHNIRISSQCTKTLQTKLSNTNHFQNKNFTNHANLLLSVL